MKHFLIAALSIVTLCSLAKADDDDSAISFAQLPQKAQAFVNANYSQADISYIVWERDDNEYSVFFNQGVKIEFNGRGDWKSVSGIDISVRFAPNAIQRYLSEKHAGAKVMKIERDWGDNEIEVKLNTGVEIKFDLNGNLKYYDR